GSFAAHKADGRDLFAHSAIIHRLLTPHWLMLFAVSLILIGIVGNEFVAVHFFSPDGILERSTVSSIRMLQALFVLSGIALLLTRRQIAASANWLRLLPFYGILASSLIPFSVNLKIDLARALRYDGLARLEEVYQQDVQLLRAIPGPVLFEDALLGFDAGKEYLFDAFASAQLMVSGNIPEQILTNRIREKYFNVIVLNPGAQKKLSELKKIQVDPLRPKASLTERWTDNTLQVIIDNYELMDLKRPNRYFFYLPRNY